MIEAVRRGDKKGLRIALLEGPVSTQIGISISGSEIAKTFTELPFAEKIRSALRAAERLERNSAVAVHARRGDIVYGEHRYRLFNSKYVPLAVVRLVIGRIKQQGMQVLLLSDDEPTLARLKEQDQVLIPNDFGAAELSSREERAAFDLGLMSRCEKIIAGTSAFTRAAAMYGNVPIMEMCCDAGKGPRFTQPYLRISPPQALTVRRSIGQNRCNGSL